MNKAYLFANPILRWLLLFLCSFLYAEEQSEFQWQASEEYTYQVEWSFIRLGTVTLKTIGIFQEAGKTYFKVRFTADSNPILFFISIHDVYDTILDESLRPHVCTTKEKSGNDIFESECRFDYEAGARELIRKNSATQKVQKHFILPFTGQLYDGLALIFYARKYIHKSKSDTLVSFFEETTGKVILNFTGKKDQIALANKPEVQDCFYLDGQIEMEGIAGVTGPFKGWFTCDEKRIPLRAELKVFLGNVTVEIEK
jgi:hypothetical protein